MRRIRTDEAASRTLVVTLALVVATVFAAVGLLGKAPPEAFHRAALGLAAVGLALSVAAELSASR